MKRQLSYLVAAAWLGGCVSQPNYSWYHPQGGEYLFAFDQRECENQVTSSGMRLGHNAEGPFFSCMYGRGYALVGPAGELLDVASHSKPTVPNAAEVTYQP